MVLAGLQSCRQRDLSRGGGHVAGRPAVAARGAASKSGGRCFAMIGDDRSDFGQRRILLLAGACLSFAVLLPTAGPGAGAQLDPSQQVGDSSLASKLLSSGDSAGGAPAEKRETSPLK